jgi:hypothetical protein
LFRQYFEISLVALCNQSWSTASRIISTAANHFGALGAGSPKGRKFKQTYLELDVRKRMLVGRLWANWPQAPFRLVWDQSKFNEIGWTPYYEHQRIQWNLKVSEGVLIKEFISNIRTLRTIQKLPDPPHGNKGKKSRGVSWKLIEALDRNQNDIGQLDGGDRHKASDARKQAAKNFVEYERALAEWLSKQNSWSFKDTSVWNEPLPGLWVQQGFNFCFNFFLFGKTQMLFHNAPCSVNNERCRQTCNAAIGGNYFCIGQDHWIIHSHLLNE